MANESAKGRVLFKEEKLGSRELVIMIVLASAATFVIMFFVFLMVEDDPAISAVFSVFFTFVIVLMGLQLLATRSQPLTIYEKGFDDPRPFLKSLGIKDRYIPFSDIGSIHPIHMNVFGTSKFVGYSIIITEERKIEIRDVDETKLQTIRKNIEFAMKGDWESKYVDAPYLGFKEMKKMKKQLARSKRSVLAEGFGLIGVSFGFFVVSGALFSYTPIFLVASPVGLIGTLFGVMRMMSYFTAITNYRVALKHDPSLERLMRVSKDIETREVEPLKAVWGFTDEDWRRLERSVHDRRPWYLMIAGFIILLISIMLRPTLLGVVLLVTGLCVLMSPIAFIPRLERDVKLVKSLVEIELRDGKRIMPEWFETGKGFSSSIALRKAPEHSDAEWRKLVQASKMRSEKGMVVLMILFMAGLLTSFALTIVLARAFHLPRIVYLGVLSVFIFIPIFLLIVIARRKHRLDSVESFEEKTGQEVIPEKYRSQIVKSWKAGEKGRG